MTETILSFGAGVQTTALTILAVKGQVTVDRVIFADTGAEKPETYWYMETYTKPLLSKAKIPFCEVRSSMPPLYEYLWEKRNIPVMRKPYCRIRWKAEPIKLVAGDAHQLIGFSAEEVRRAENPGHKGKRFPLIEMGLTASDCIDIILEHGWPIPLKSSCFICPFQSGAEWNWLKTRHPELFDRALALEARLYERKPGIRQSVGLWGGKPLWKFAEGMQESWPLFGYSCWDGYCGR